MMILLIVIVVSAIIAISFFFFINKDSNILSKVPKDAKSVIIIDLQSLSTKLLLDELSSDEKSTGKLAEMLPDSLKNIDWTSNGINLLDNAVFFSTENTDTDNINVNLILSIANYSEFKKFIKSLSENIFLDITKKQNSIYSKKYNLLISWNRKFVITSFQSKNKEENIKFLSLKKEKSIVTDSSFMKKQTANYDILFYSVPYFKYPKKYNAFINSNIQSFTSFINFKDGELEFKAELKPKTESLLENLFKVSKKEQVFFNILDSCALNIILDINSVVFFKIIEQNSSIKLNKEKIPIIAAWNGNTNIVVDGSKVVENKYVSYEYDDDFNKIEKIKIVKDKIWDIKAVLGVNKTILDSVLQKSKFYKNKTDTLFFKGSNFIIKNIGDSYLCYNKNINRPQIKVKLKTDNINIELNYKRFISLLKETEINYDTIFLNKLNLKKLKLSINKKEKINIFGNFYFTDKEKNSFFSIVENFNNKNVQ